MTSSSPRERLPGVLNWIIPDLSSAARREALELPPLASHVGPRLLMAASTLRSLEQALWTCFDDELFRLKRRTFIVDELCTNESLLTPEGEVPAFVTTGLRAFFEDTLDPAVLGDLPRCMALLEAQLIFCARLLPSLGSTLARDAPPYQHRILEWTEALRKGDEAVTELVGDFCTPSPLRAGLSAGIRGDALLFALVYQNKHRVRLSTQDQRHMMQVLLRTLEEGTCLLLGCFPQALPALPQLQIEPLDVAALEREAQRGRAGLNAMVEAAQREGEGVFFPFGPPLE